MRKIVWLTGLLTLAACAPPDPLTPEPDVVEPSLDGADDGSGGDVAPEDRTSTPVDGTRRDDIADVGPARIDAPPDVAAPDAPPDVAAPDAAPDAPRDDAALDAPLDLPAEAAACPSGQRRCGGACVDVGTDPFHCGACGAACAAGATCFAGSCSASCGPMPTLAPGDTFEHPGTGLPIVPSGCGTGLRNNTAFFNVLVPPGQQLQVSARVGAHLEFLSSCDGACLGVVWSRAAPPGNGNGRTWTNRTASAARVLVAVRSNFDGFALPMSATVRVAPPPDASACATAPLLPDGARLAAVSTAGADAAAAPCGILAMRVPALWYRVAVPPGRRVIAEARGGSLSSTGGINLAFLDACDAPACVGAEGINPWTAPAVTATWRNTGAAERTIYLVTWGLADPFDLSVTLSPPTAQSTCAGRTTLTPGVALAGQRFVDAEEPVADCSTPPTVTVPAQYYRVVVPARQRVEVLVTSAEGWHRTRLIGACGDRTCLAGDRVYAASTRSSTMPWSNMGSTSRDVIVAVSRNTSVASGLTGTFSVTASLAPVAANASCAAPLALADGVAVSGHTLAAVDPAPACGAPALPSLFYSISVPAGRRVLARLEGGGVARVLSDCAASACLGESLAEGWAWWHNTAASARSVLVAVSRTAIDPEAPFTLTATIDAPPTNGRCSTAAAVASTATLPPALLVGAAEPFPVCLGTRPALYYRVSLPPRHRLMVTAGSRGQPAATIGLSVAASCASTTCLAATEQTGPRNLWTNATAATAEVILALTPRAPPPYPSLAADTRVVIEPAPAEALCATAPVLTPGSPVAVPWDASGEPATLCETFRQPTATHFFAVDVPAGRLLTPSLAAPAGVSWWMRVLPGCAASTCLTPLLGAGPFPAISWRNPDATTRRVYVAVSAEQPPTATAPGSLTVTVGP